MRVPGGGALLVSVALVACGAVEHAKGASPSPAPAPAAHRGADDVATPNERLEGLWEITRYTSDRPIPEAAMPMMGAMFDVLRLRFEGTTSTATAGKIAEKLPFSIEGGRDGHFTLRLPGGIFDGADCHFVDADTLELHDAGKAWPGVSVLTRSR